MKIGIVGAGDVAATIGNLWAATGHDVVLSSRHPDKRSKAETSLQIMSVDQAARFGEVIFLAVNYWTVDEAIAAMAAGAAGKLVIDATNPLRYAEGGGTERVIPEDALVGEIMATKLPRSRVAKAFTTLWTRYLQSQHHRAAPLAAIAYAADATADRETIARLIGDAGFEPVLLGDLSQSRPLDPPSPIWNVVLTADELRERAAAFAAAPSAA